MKVEVWQAFVVGAVLSWGAYVPVLHEGQRELGKGNPGAGAMRAFLCVGLAYLLTAVLIPTFLMARGLAGGERFEFNAGGVSFAVLGGVAGAAGALCIILALKNGGKPLIVAPLVFAGAPIVNSIVSLLWHPKGMPGWMFYAGIVLAAVGAGMVLYSKGQLDAAGQAHSAAPPAAAAPVGAGGST